VREPTFESAEISLGQAEVEQVKGLVKHIRNTKHFKAILKDARPEMRRGVYDLLKPLLEFNVAPFDKLMKATLKRETNKGRKST
jgi:hypothetical protein